MGKNKQLKGIQGCVWEWKNGILGHSWGMKIHIFKGEEQEGTGNGKGGWELEVGVASGRKRIPGNRNFRGCFEAAKLPAGFTGTARLWGGKNPNKFCREGGLDIPALSQRVSGGTHYPGILMIQGHPVIQGYLFSRDIHYPGISIIQGHPLSRDIHFPGTPVF